MKTIDRRNICFIEYLEYLFKQENITKKYRTDALRIFKRFLYFCDEKFPRSIKITMHNRQACFCVKRIYTYAIKSYINAFKGALSTKYKTFYILKKYAVYFNKDHRCELKLSKISDYKIKRREKNKEIIKVINFLKHNELREDLVSLYFINYLGLSIYNLALLKTNNIKISNSKIKVVYNINRANKNKVVVKELYEALKNLLIDAIKNEAKHLFYNNLISTSESSRKKAIEERLKNFIIKSGLSVKNAQKILISYNKERKSIKLSEKEKQFFQDGIEIGNGIIDTEMSIFSN